VQPLPSPPEPPPERSRDRESAALSTAATPAELQVLIVDDREDSVRILGRCLRQIGYRVRFARTGVECLTQAQAGDINLILLDINLPDTDGFAICRLLKGNPETNPIPIIFISASNSTDDRVRAFEVGGEDYLPKPFCLEEVKVRIGHHLKILAAQKLLQETNRKLEAEIAERRRTEATLKEQSRYLQTVLDNVPQQIFWKDANLRFLGCNRNWARQAKIGDPQSIIGKSDFDLLEDAERAAAFRAEDEKVLASNQMQATLIHQPARHDHEGDCWLDVRRIPFHDDGGQVIGILGVLEDVTERRRAEEKLRAAEEKYRSIFENAAEGIFQASRDGRFLSMNPTMARLLGFGSPEEAIATLQDVDRQLYVQSKRRHELMAYLEQYEDISDFQSEIYRHDGSRIWVSENVRNVRDKDGNFLYLEGTVQDVTERKLIETQLYEQRKKSEHLLLNILPQRIAQRLKQQRTTAAENFDAVTVLFADIVGFTELASRVPATDLVRTLNEIFSAFDRLTERHKVEKIKTIGDAYMAVAGVPSPMQNHGDAIAALALDMLSTIEGFCSDDGVPFQLRIGVHTGPVVAGVIGLRKFIYDLWGDTVNIASRMESQGEPGRIQVTENVCELLGDRFEFEPRGLCSVKGRGEMLTYWLVGRSHETPTLELERPR
jgi:adenylate cyclase